MPLVTVRTAAELTGKDRTTIARAIAAGKVSATKSELGHYLVDPAELERVYGALRNASLHPDATPDFAPPHEEVLASQLELTREMLEHERTHYGEARASFERDRRAWEEERAFMRGMLEKHTDQIKLLTDQRERAEQEHDAAAQPRSLLARMFGRR